MTYQKLKRSDYGASFLELALVMPALIFILAGAFEFSMLLQTSQRVSSVTRLVGQAAFRACANIIDGSPNDYKACIVRGVNQTSGVRNGTLPGIDLVLSLYNYNSPPPPPPDGGDDWIPLPGEANLVGKYAPEEQDRQSSYDGHRVDAEVSSLSAQNPRVLIAEVSYTYKPFFSIFKPLLGNYAIRETGIY